MKKISRILPLFAIVLALLAGCSVSAGNLEEANAVSSLGNGLTLTVKQAEKDGLLGLQFGLENDKSVFQTASLSARADHLETFDLANSYLVHKETKEKIYPLDNIEGEPWSLYFAIDKSDLSAYTLHYETGAFLIANEDCSITFTREEDGTVTFDNRTVSLPNGHSFCVKNASIRDDETVRQFVDGDPKNQCIDIEYEVSDGLRVQLTITDAYFTGSPIGETKEKSEHVWVYSHPILKEEKRITVQFHLFSFYPLFTGEMQL